MTLHADRLARKGGYDEERALAWGTLSDSLRFEATAKQLATGNMPFDRMDKAAAPRARVI
jgi:hypothetical protein